MIVDNWNYNITEAPRGSTREVTLTDAKGKEAKRTVFVAEFVIVCCDDDSLTVLKSWWLQSESRWVNLGTKETPLAWMPWPAHPKAEL